MADVCAELLGRRIAGVERLAGGRNSQVFRLDCSDAGGPPHYVAKQYVAMPEDPRDRLQTEFGALRFLKSRGVAAVPSPIAMDPATRCAVYEFAAGERASLRAPDASDISQAVALLAALRAIARESTAADAGIASEACFSIAAIGANLDGRVARLRRLPDTEPGVADLHRFLDLRWRPFLAQLDRWTEAQSRAAGIDRGAEITPRERTLSPSDFGFHNALRDVHGQLVFVDFEYFGWDDPAKMLVDFLHHPAMTLSDGQKRAFAAGILHTFDDLAGLAARARLVYPWFGLKWCLILLNEFVPEHLRRRSFAGVAGPDRAELLRHQLDRAERLLDRLGAEYPDNHLLD